MSVTSCAVAAAAAAALGASVVYAVMSSRRPSTYDSSSEHSSSPPSVSSQSNLSLHLPLARDHDGCPWLPVPTPANTSASRHVIKADALEWLKQQSTLPGSVVTSLPDVGEVKLSRDEYEPWFQAACELVFSKVAPGQFAIFYQTDIKMLEGAQVNRWLDKSFLVSLAARACGFTLLFRKVVPFSSTFGCKSVKFGRPSYSHVLCFAKDGSCSVSKGAWADVSARGSMVYKRAMGADCAVHIIKFLAAHSVTHVTDPFCGKGTVLAAANAFGISAQGVDVSAKQVKDSQRVVLFGLPPTPPPSSSPALTPTPTFPPQIHTSKR